MFIYYRRGAWVENGGSKKIMRSEGGVYENYLTLKGGLRKKNVTTSNGGDHVHVTTTIIGGSMKISGSH